MSLERRELEETNVLIDEAGARREPSMKILGLQNVEVNGRECKVFVVSINYDALNREIQRLELQRKKAD